MTAEFDVAFDLGAFEELMKTGIAAVSKSVEFASIDLWGNIRAEAPVDEGRLAGSWELLAVDDLEFRIGTNVLYALMVQEGTGVFGPKGVPIVPVTASVLRFETRGGEVIFARSVQGMEANPYVDRAMERTSARAGVFAGLALQEVGVA